MATKNKDINQDKKHGITKEQADNWAEQEADSKIAGKGFLFHVHDKHLPESTRLNLQEALSLAVNDAQEYAVHMYELPEEEQISIYEFFRNRLMRYRISCGGEEWGEGRKESIILHQLSQDERDNAVKGAMFGGNA